MMNEVYEGGVGGEEPFVAMGIQDQRNHYYRDSQFRSAPDISDHGLPIFSIVSSPLIVGRFFSGYEVIQTVCVFSVLSPSAFGTTNLSNHLLLYSISL